MSDEPYCRPVEVDGVTALVRSAGEMTDHDRAVISAALAELRRRRTDDTTEETP